MKGEKAIQMCLFPDHDFRTSPKRRGKTANDFTDYDGFVEKFKVKKTTDDCYTPAKVYEAVLRFVGEMTDIADRPIVRPFYPEGNYREYDYPKNCIVVDNPPFSIYSQIVRFYISAGIDFFLFAPHLTLFVKDADCSYVVTDADITYENGAVVKTSFATNLIGDLRIWVCPELRRMIAEVQKKEKPNMAKNTYPMEVVASSLLGRIICRGVELKMKKSDCIYVSNLDYLRGRGKSLFGGGFLLSEKAAAERAAAERAAGCTVKLSEREKELIKSLA